MFKTPEKRPFGNMVRPASKVTVLSPEPRNELFAVDKLLGISMCVNDEQPLKASTPSDDKFLDNVIELKFVQRTKAPVPICVTLSDTTTATKSFLSLNA
jgi:hypothetical protein